MTEAMSRNEVPGDPLRLEGDSHWVAISALVVRILGMAALAAYSAWFLRHVTGNVAAITEAEGRALGSLASALGGAMPAAAAMAGPAIAGWVVACILAALFLVYVWNEWRKKIVTEWKWVWRCLTSGSWWDKLLGVFGFVLVLVETVFWILVTVLAVVVVYINLRVLIPVLP